MQSFPIKINDITIMSDDIYAYLRKGKRKEAAQYIIDQTNCSEARANEVVKELIEITKRRSAPKPQQVIPPPQNHKYIDMTKTTLHNSTNPNTPHCPTCGSTNIKKISATSKFMGAIGFGLFSKTARSQFECKNCGYKW